MLFLELSDANSSVSFSLSCYTVILDAQKDCIFELLKSIVVRHNRKGKLERKNYKECLQLNMFRKKLNGGRVKEEKVSVKRTARI